jgi:hypothetical protein
MRWRVAIVLTALVGFAPGSAQSEALGRLFYTPDERKQLDDVRERYDPSRQEVIVKAGPAVQAARPPPPMPDLSVEGLVIRSDGKNATWINGTNLLSGESTDQGIRVEADGTGGAVRFVLPNGTDTGPIKPGQRLDPNLGKIHERYSLSPQGSGDKSGKERPKPQS